MNDPIMKTYISGLFFALALAKFLYTMFMNFTVYGYQEAMCLAAIGMLAHFVFERHEVAK